MNKLQTLLLSIAPTIGAAFGGPLGAGAVNIATKALGLGDDADHETIIKTISHALANDGEAIKTLKEADNNYRATLIRAGVDLERIHAADRDSARDMAAATKSIMPMIVAAWLFISTTVVAYFAVRIDNPSHLILFIASGLFTMCGAVVQFYFGSSKSSSDKNQIFASKNWRDIKKD